MSSNIELNYDIPGTGEVQPYIAAVIRLLEMGENEAALRLLKMPDDVKFGKWGYKYNYLHRWLNNAFDWDEEEQIVGSQIWLDLHDKLSLQRIKLYTDEQ